MRRRVVLVLLLLVAGMVAVLAALPLWLGLAIKQGGASRGFTFSKYERIGYSRFALHDVEVRSGNVRVAVKRVEIDTPVLWGWRHWRDRSADVTTTDWIV